MYYMDIMTSTIQNLTNTVIPDNDFMDGKLCALRILHESYQEMEIKGVKFVSISELLNTIRTLVLNLEKQGGYPIE
jgi:hypothetical protein